MSKEQLLYLGIIFLVGAAYFHQLDKLYAPEGRDQPLLTLGCLVVGVTCLCTSMILATRRRSTTDSR